MDKTIVNPLRGIAMKVCSIVLFVCMSSLIKLGGEGLATGQITFFRSFFAMFPILGWLLISGELKGAFKTANPVGHFYRGFIGVSSMALGFYGIVHLPLPEYIAIGYAQPLFAVIAGWLMLGEIVRRYRWSAVAAGFVGVVIILWPRLEAIRSGTLGLEGTMGAAAVLTAAAISAVAMVHVRQLVRTENTPTIVLYFSLSSSCFALLTLPFGWVAMTPASAGLLIVAGFFGGAGQILLTESYRYADVSAVAPFEYTSIIWGTIAGYFLFSEFPDHTLILGTIIVIGSGIFIIYRENRLAKERIAAHRREKIIADA
jgi:drug/metabolite transporter (DMT)-like permease